MWMTIPEAAKHSYELLHCGRKKGCTTLCTDVKAELPCKPLSMHDDQFAREAQSLFVEKCYIPGF